MQAIMPAQEMQLHGVMEGGGAYNAHARLQASGQALALPLLEDAIQQIPLEASDKPVVIADYGSAQGRNSLCPMSVAIQALRRRIGATRPISVFHIDQPANDFNSLFHTVSSDPASYQQNDRNVYSCAVGRSFYEQVLPPESVDLGWCSYAALWLSSIPATIPGHFIFFRSADGLRAKFARQAAADWERFLELRARELRPGSQLIIVLPGMDDNGVTGMEEFFDHGNAALMGIENNGIISAEERERMVLGVYARRRSELSAPFAGTPSFCNLMLRQYEIFPLSDPGWTQFQADGDAEALAAKRALLFRATFIPSLEAAFMTERSAADREAFAAALTHALQRRFAAEPAPINGLVQILALAKCQ